MKEESTLIKSGSLLFLSTLLVNAGNYAINLLLGRWLGPSDFSEVSLLVTFMLMVSFVALAFQLTSAKYIITFDSGTNQQSLFIRWLNKKAIIVGLILMCVVLGLSLVFKDFFQTTSTLPFIIFGIALPAYLLMSVNRGIYQGLLIYTKLALSYQYEMWIRLIVSIILLYLGWRVNGAALGITLSLIITWLLSRRKINIAAETAPKPIDFKPIIVFFLTILLYECSQILINNSDIVLVKHFFTPHEAGLYAALALIGRIVYFGTWTVVTMLFPMVVKLEKEGKSHTKYFLGGLAVVGTLASLIVGFCFLFPDFTVSILFGSEYLTVAPLLWKYALATALFACSNVFVYYHLSLDNSKPVWITIIAGVLQIILISLFHENFEQVISIQILLMAGLFIAMNFYHFLIKR